MRSPLPPRESRLAYGKRKWPVWLFELPIRGLALPSSTWLYLADRSPGTYAARGRLPAHWLGPLWARAACRRRSALCRRRRIHLMTSCLPPNDRHPSSARLSLSGAR